MPNQAARLGELLEAKKLYELTASLYLQEYNLKSFYLSPRQLLLLLQHDPQPQLVTLPQD
jgi:hypothetical protein